MAVAARLPRAGFLAAALLCLGLDIWFWRLPPAQQWTRHDLNIAAGEELVLRAPAANEGLMNLPSPAGQATDLRFERARLGFDTLALMRSAGARPSGDTGPIQWINDASGEAASRISIALTDPAPAAELVLTLEAGSENKNPELELRVSGAELAVSMAAVQAHTPQLAQANMRLIESGHVFRLPGALPVSVDVTDGGSLRLRVSAAPPPWDEAGRYRYLRLGAAGAADRLSLRAFGIRRAGSDDWRLFACAARPGGILWSSASLAAGRCEQGPVAQALTVGGLALRADGFDLNAQGWAWVWAADGTARVGPFARLRQSPAQAAVLLLPALAGLLCAFFAMRPLRGTAKPGGVRVFISYRRQDTAAVAGRLYDHLARAFGPDKVFRDIYRIAPGAEFARVIEQRMAESDAALILIGPRWLERDAAGARRIDAEHDFVRREIAQALQQQKAVVPILVDGTAMPSGADLPADIASLVRFNALDLSDAHFDADIQRLLGMLDPKAAEAGTEG
ncbi:MAG: toll/interleukin-1 receptor domain-containing protein [Rhodocyclaceae bacterium]|nr:toll/interleukin-1 receptor domain-containing protein [Rhodocyclaceae bacterium]